MERVPILNLRPGRALLLVAVLLLAGISVSGKATPTTAASAVVAAPATNPCAPLINPVVCENSLPGSPSSEWAMSGSGDSSIQGFTTDMSVDKGSTISFKVNTTATAYSIVIYRMGYYGGLGARQITTISPSVALPQSQPACLTDPTTLLYDCGDWGISASWTVPTTAVSGIYFAKLMRADTGGFSLAVFVVRDDLGTSDLLFQTSDTTWQAYDTSGGHSLYKGVSNDVKADKVSYNRPNTHKMNDKNWVFNTEYPTVRWLEANGYDVSYFTGVDSDRLGSLIKQHRVFLSVGHDEYWSNGQRVNVEAARDAGVSLAFLSGNVSPVKTRWEPSIDATVTSYRTLVCYKETEPGYPTDPLDPSIWTGMWRDNRFSPPADGGRPENEVTGQLAMVGVGGLYTLQVPAADGTMRFWRNTTIAQLSAGQVAMIGAGCNCLIGYEFDEDVDNGLRPDGLFHLSTTIETVPQMILDSYGAKEGPGVATHSFTMYHGASGALVFDAGTVNYAYALDGNSFYESTTPDSNIQQATVNLLADMSVQPARIQPGLTLATPSTDTTAPTSQITFPTSNDAPDVGYLFTITGTAADTGGGVVGAVEISTDGGFTWHPTTGREQWSYTWSPTSPGSATIISRAVDDSGNIESFGAGVRVVVATPQMTATPTSTTTSVVITATATRTSTATRTASATRTSTSTRTSTATRTPSSTRTPRPTNPPEPTSTETPTPHLSE